jgi:hypothetical protein
MPALYQLIEKAIKEKKQITATYGGHYRELCPHTLGKNKDGHLQCLCYQFGGSSSSKRITPGSTHNWRCMELDKLSNVKLREGAWFSAPNHSRPSNCLEIIYVEVEH